MKNLINKLRELRQGGFFYILFGGTLSKLVAFFSSIVVVRLLDKSSYAALAYADNIFFYITLFSGLGMASAVLKFCVNENEQVNMAYYKFAFKWGSLFQTLVLVFVACIIYKMQLPFLEAKSLIFLLIPYGFLHYWYVLFQSFLRTRFENKKYAVSGFVQVLLTFCLSIVFVLFFGVAGVPYARTVAILFSIILFFGTVTNYLKSNFDYKLTKKEIRTFLTLAGSLLISNIFSMIMPANEAFLVNNLIKDEIVSANYKVANLIPSQLPFITSTIMVYYFPIFAKKSQEKNLWPDARNVGLNISLINGIIVICGIFLTPIIIRVAYGDAYSDTKNLSSALWMVYYLNAGFRMIPMNILPALGYVKFNVIISIASSLVHFVLDYFFITNWGINGAVFATAIIYLFTGILYWGYLYIKCRGKV